MGACRIRDLLEGGNGADCWLFTVGSKRGGARGDPSRRVCNSQSYVEQTPA